MVNVQKHNNCRIVLKHIRENRSFKCLIYTCTKMGKLGGTAHGNEVDNGIGRRINMGNPRYQSVQKLLAS
jgi:hypothetical protein